MEVLLLGTGSADGWPNPFCACDSCAAARSAGIIRGQSAALVDEVLLLDCGPEAPRAAARAGRSLAAVRDVLLTHSHPDHTGPAALLWRAWAGRSEPITVHGPAQAIDACRDWVGPDDPVTFHVVEAGDRFSTGAHDILALEAAHGDEGSGPGLLWDITQIRGNGPRLLYATDTGWPPGATLAALAEGRAFDLVLLEETFGDRAEPSEDHLDLTTFTALVGTLAALGAVVATTQVVAIHLGHHNPAPAELDRRLADTGARAGRDGETISVGDASRPRRLLLLGGARSGKSREAERVLGGCPSVTYVATGGGRPDDQEWRQRVEQHRARRPAHWTTLETTDVVSALDQAGEGDAVLVDCLSLWLTDVMDRRGWHDEAPVTALDVVGLAVDDLVEAVDRTRGRVILVSNEVGQGVVPGTRSGREFRDALGRLNQAVASAVDDVVLVVAGQSLVLKGMHA
jgi:adenosylcobinamide kinase / adenosylcobinamide-phosphate guanylyltransferase